MRTWAGVLAIGLAVSVLAASAAGRTIQLDDFSGHASVESFEGLNRPSLPNASINLPIPFIFPSGVAITQPAPNRTDSFGVFIIDGGGFFGYSFESIVPYIPSGTAYVGQANAGGITFSFAQPIYRVGLFVAADPFHGGLSGPVEISIRDTTGQVLETTVVTDVLKETWKTSFIGFENASGIKHIHIKGDGGDVLRIDNLTFEVPEPASASLVACIALLLARRRV